MWECLVCGSLNPPHNVICGSAECQLRRLREFAGPPATPARESRNGTADAPATPALAAVAGVSSKGSKPRAKNHTYPAEFEVFWKEYPLRKDKLAALRAWKRAVAGGASPATLREAAGRYRNDPSRKPEFTKYAERWLNAGGWLDEDAADRPESHEIQATDWDAYRAEEDARIAALLAEEA